MSRTRLRSLLKKTTRIARRGFWTTTTSRGCTRCSRRLTVRCSLRFSKARGDRLTGAFLTAKERLIGWYHTGPKLRAADQEINDLFKQFIARPVMVIVDVRPQTVGIPTDAYFAVEEIKD